MFHLVLTACLNAAPQDCAPVLLPEGDSPDAAACEAGAPDTAARWLADRPALTGGAPRCVANADLPASDLRRIAPGVYVHLGQPVQFEESPDGRIANLGVVIGETVAVIDAGVSRAEGQALYVAIRRLTERPLSDLILTHMHPDHVLGAPVFHEAGARITAHAALPQALEARAEAYLENMAQLLPPGEWIGTGIVLPDATVADEARIDLGGRVLHLRAGGVAHTDNDLTVLDAATGTLFTGDLVFRDLTPVLDGSLRGWLDWMATAPQEAGEVRRIVPGHGPVSESWPEAMGPQQVFLKSLADEVRRQIAAGNPLSQAVPDISNTMKTYENFWNSFQITLARNATAAYKELEWE